MRYLSTAAIASTSSVELETTGWDPVPNAVGMSIAITTVPPSRKSKRIHTMMHGPGLIFHFVTVISCSHQCFYSRLLASSGVSP